MLTFYCDTCRFSPYCFNVQTQLHGSLRIFIPLFHLARGSVTKRGQEIRKKNAHAADTGGSSRIPLRQENSCRGARCPTGLSARAREYSSIKYS